MNLLAQWPLWAAWNTEIVPRFTVYRLIAFDTSTGIYWFMSRDVRQIRVGFNVHQLERAIQKGGFKPFLFSGGKSQGGIPDANIPT
jgi:hypothetical protein